MIKAQTLKGFRDFLPADAARRGYVIKKLREIFERYGFDPLETPALEYAETLMGKYGSEADQLLYLFKDNGGRDVGMRYDQTVPLSRVVAQYQATLPTPFKRYQIQPVWRAENTQKGRFREFLQCDIDTIGSASPLADAEIIDCTITSYKTLGLTGLTMLINDRTLFDDLALTKAEIIIIDKLDKLGRDAVIAQLAANGRTDAKTLFETLKNSRPPKRLALVFEALKNLGYKEDVDYRFDPFLARGLEYYTSTIFELKSGEYHAGSLAGGGRYDSLIGTFTGKDTPAVGIAFGFDRILEAMDDRKLLPAMTTVTQVLITIFEPTLLADSLSLAAILRNKAIPTEIYMDYEAKLEKQLKYADRKGIPYVIIQGPDEKARNVVKWKDMKAKKQSELSVDALIDTLTRSA